MEINDLKLQLKVLQKENVINKRNLKRNINLALTMRATILTHSLGEKS